MLDSSRHHWESASVDLGTAAASRSSNFHDPPQGCAAAGFMLCRVWVGGEHAKWHFVGDVGVIDVALSAVRDWHSAGGRLAGNE